MNYLEIKDDEAMSDIKECYHQAGLPFEQFYSKAYEKALASIPNASAQALIRFIISLLALELVKQAMKPAKTRMGRILRFIWSFGGLFSTSK